MPIVSLLAGLFGLQLEATADKVKRAVILNSVIGLFGLVAFGFLLFAGYLALARATDPILAALYMGAGAVVIAIVAYLVGVFGHSSRRHKEVERKRSSETNALITTAALSALPIVLRSPMLRRIGLPLGALAAFIAYSTSRHDDGDEL